MAEEGLEEVVAGLVLLVLLFANPGGDVPIGQSGRSRRKEKEQLADL